MPIRRIRTFAALFLLLAAGAAASPRTASAQEGDPRVVTEARAFMEAYARDLSNADREGIANRYDRRGVIFVFNGNREMAEWDAVREQYLTRWQAPSTFSWGDLVYEPAGRDAVVVNGYFFWTQAPGEEPMRFSYTALLLRRDGELRIRLENEFPAPAPLPAEAPPAP